MDQIEEVGSKLNAEAPEFVPSNSSSSFRLFPYFQPQPFYGYNNHNISINNTNNTNNTNINNSTDIKIVNQVEFYFSDINLATTDHLFMLMIKDPQGYVPLSVVASFNKIKAAINSTTQLATILRISKKLVASDDGKKVRRRDALTQSDMEQLQSRIVIAENLPDDHSHQNLLKLFSSVGSVKSIRACPPLKSNGGKGDHMHFSSKFHAFVEYESLEVAEKAVVELTDEGNWRNGLKVRLLLTTMVKPAPTRVKNASHESQLILRTDEAIVAEMRHIKGNQPGNSLPPLDFVSHGCQSSEDNSQSKTLQKKSRNYGVSGVKGRGKGQRHGRERCLYPNNEGTLGFPQVSETPGSIEKLNNVSKTPAGPRMPDGTRGFAMGRGKPVDIKVS